MHDLYVALAGIFGGMALTAIFRWFRTAFGTLRIDHSNPEKDIYRLDIDDLDKINKKRVIILKVDHNADLSQK